MRTHRFRMPVDPWPRASLVERLAVSAVLGALLLVVACAAGLGILVVLALGVHVYRSYDLGASVRARIERRAARRAAVGAAIEARVAASGADPVSGPRSLARTS